MPVFFFLIISSSIEKVIETLELDKGEYVIVHVYISDKHGIQDTAFQ
jgi:response regulator of citrate/malate metabolism